MAQIGAVHSVGESLIRYLSGAHDIERTVQASLPSVRQTLPESRFEQVSGTELNTDYSPGQNTVSVYLFRVGIDKNLRATADHKFPKDPKTRPLSLELHYLISVWAASSADEQTLMSWTMLALHRGALLDRAGLEPDALWEPDETVQILPSEMSHENMMRIWESLDPNYRLSVSYIARTVRLETGVREEARPVVATKFDFQRRWEDSDA
ncbi:MAG: DUF4255 domain-containing protein [Aliishimia sp.]